MSDRKWQGPDGHVPTAMLMLYLDGESAGDETAVGKHLQECWTCRERLEWLNRGVLTFLDYYRNVLVAGLPDNDEQPELLCTLRREAAMDTVPGKWLALRERISGAIRRFSAPVWATAAASLSLLVTLSWLWFVEPAKLTASEFLQRACAESTLAATKANATGRRRVRIRHGKQVFDREIDGGVRKAPAELPDSDMLAALQRAQIDWEDPLNPRNFARWHRSVAKPQDSIRESPTSITLETTVASDAAVRSVSFTVNRADWRPAGQHVEFRGQPALDVDEFELSAQPEETKAVSRPVRPTLTPEPPAADSGPTGPTPEQLDDTEVRLREALHGLQADFYAAPVIRREANQVGLLAFAPTVEQRDEILQAIQDIPFVSERILAPGLEDSAPQGSEPPPPQPVAPAKPPAQKTRAPLADSLRKYCGGLEEANSYLAVLAESHSETLMAASALQSLADRYPATDWSRLSPDLQARLGRLIEDYLTRLRRSAHSYDALESPVLDAMLREAGIATNETEHPAPACCLSWREESAGIVGQVQRMHSILTRLFAGVESDRANGSPPVSGLLIECDRARVELKRLLHAPPSANPPGHVR